ncbi:conserved membrane protein, unknown function [Hepatocystis sp. ex Piliocolobus tephrosceles]|nr:conserved membrane protein, unknown function [Hepatocystis sp. ex Piliocolobus tephrosceles]
MPLGIFLLLSCLLKIKFLVKFSYTFCRKQIGDTTIRLVTLILMLNVILFITESFKLQYGVLYKYNNPLSNEIVASFSPDYMKVYRWRHERNWWLSLCNFCIWLMLWRSTSLMNNYFKYLEKRKKQTKCLYNI